MIEMPSEFFLVHELIGYNIQPFRAWVGRKIPLKKILRKAQIFSEIRRILLSLTIDSR